MTVDIVKLHLPTLKLITKGNVQFHVTICYPLFCFLFLLITKLEGLRGVHKTKSNVSVSFTTSELPHHPHSDLQMSARR